MAWDKAWINARLLTMSNQATAYGLVENGAIACENSCITWLGPMQEFTSFKLDKQTEIIDCKNRMISPGLIDCHTHLIYAGDRANEFEQGLKGVSYQEIAAQGGGILSTVKATREASEDKLYQLSKARLKYFIAEGVTTVEIKSGYGLSIDSEIKMLRVAKRLNDSLPIEIISTFLGAHTVPPEFKDQPDAYIDLICEQILPLVAKENLATAVDGFCESIAFNTEQIQRVFNSAKQHGLKVKLHADQLSNTHSAKLAAESQALSADHLEYTDLESIEAMANNGTVAVLLPGAYYYLNETQKPPIELFRQYKIPIAIASDSNPGSSPILSLLAIINMACIQFKLTPEESLLGATINAAKALGINKRCGSLEVGKQADLALWDIEHPAELAYSLGNNPCYSRVKAGQIIPP